MAFKHKKYGAIFYVVLLIAGLLIILGGWLTWQLPQYPSDFHSDSLLSGIVGALVGALLTLLLAYVAWKQIYQVSRTESASFVLDIKKEFFKEPTRTLVAMIENEVLEFVRPKEPRVAYFEVNTKLLAQLGLPPKLLSGVKQKPIYSTYEVDDLLLGHFEDLGLLAKMRIVELQMIYGMFGWYIVKTWESDAIKAYIESERSTPDGADIYEDFEYIYKKCKDQHPSGQSTLDAHR